MTQKIPPPPPIASMDPAFNRWLIELTSILSDNGGIDPGSVDGLQALQLQVAGLISQVAAINLTIGSINGQIAIINGQVAALDTRMTAAEAAIVALQLRAQVFNGTGPPPGGLGADNDWYFNTSGGAGARLYIKLSTVWTAMPI